MFDPKVAWLRLKGMEDAPRLAAMRDYSRLELLQLLRAGLDDLHRQIEQWPELILDSMDKKLATDEPSKAVTDSLLDRLRRPEGQ